MGEKATLEIQRGKQSISYQIPVSEKVDLQKRLADLVTREQAKIPQLGIPAVTLDEKFIAELWTHVGVPVLGIYGTGDFVTAEDDHRRIVAIVNANHPGTATLHTIDGMDHHLGAAGSPQAAYDLRVKDHKETPYEQRLSAEVATWLCSHTHCG